MNIARVIVDVPSSNVNQLFDYEIPLQLQPIIQPGMRVVIPFGPRKITGFVMERISVSPNQPLKEIIDTLDVVPVLTEELLELGKWVANDTLSLYISTYHAMLPQMLKAKYDKVIQRQTSERLPDILEEMFAIKSEVPYENFTQTPEHYRKLQQYVQTGDISIEYIVKNQAKKKYKTIIIPAKLDKLLEIEADLSKQATKQRYILDFFIEHPDPIDQKKVYNLLSINRQQLNPLLEKQAITLDEIEVYRNPYEREISPTTNLTLTEEQSNALDPIHQAINEEVHNTFLLHGVTGSGKTEIYLQAIDRVLQKGKEAIVLVPEIALTPQMVRRFKARFGSDVAVLHSALSIGEKYDEWRKVLRKEVRVVVGARSAIFAPFENLGILIIDEEHETTYKQEESPRYHAKDVAIKRGEYNQCPVVLGSATPTLESYARAQKGVYQLLQLSKRTNEQQMPDIQTVDMRDELHSGNRTMFSQKLTEKIKYCIEHQQQIVLLLNRRGYSNFALCRDCGHVEECPNCDISLTYHKRDHRLKCHYCAYEQAMPALCPKCDSEHIRFFGTGTQRVEEALTKLIPEARVIRMDVDTTRRKGAHERLLERFSNQEADILLGTQMIAKGLDFENVTLVGVLAADSLLHLPDFRSAEKTFQLITQVSGRAGRHRLPGEVIVQTYTPDHYSITLASQYKYQDFYEKEMKMRHAFLYPPYMFLVLFTLSDENKLNVYQTALQLQKNLANQTGKNVVILGPSPSPLARVKKRFRYQIMIKYRDKQTLLTVIREALQQTPQKKGLQITVDFNPYHLM
ncbi:MAG TPA: primosomal protein N' [Pseudogracilibacillus sp.]|nr:primosomal protein N' [Pseudogracilibacillus sp.]